jgi:hypothetical protein
MMDLGLLERDFGGYVREPALDFGNLVILTGLIERDCPIVRRIRNGGGFNNTGTDTDTSGGASTI